MSSITSNIASNYDDHLKSVFTKAGFIFTSKLCDTLQGSIWRASTNTDHDVVVKVTSKYLHEHQIAFANHQTIHGIQESIVMEAAILRQLSQHPNVPKSIVKYYGFFQTATDYFLIEEYGGEQSLFDFTVKIHQLLSLGYIEISEWHKVVKVIFKQMVECIAFLHSLNICHFDISLENFLINDVQIKYNRDEITNVNKIEFVEDSIQLKLVDFGLSAAFDSDDENPKSNKYVGKAAYKSPEIVAKNECFDPKSNDVWCLGVCLFMLNFGGIPWHKASVNEEAFVYIMNGHLLDVLKVWNKSHYVDKEMMHLFDQLFKYEDKRLNIKQIMKHSWLKSKIPIHSIHHHLDEVYDIKSNHNNI